MISKIIIICQCVRTIMNFNYSDPTFYSGSLQIIIIGFYTSDTLNIKFQKRNSKNWICNHNKQNRCSYTCYCNRHTCTWSIGIGLSYLYIRLRNSLSLWLIIFNKWKRTNELKWVWMWCAWNTSRVEVNIIFTNCRALYC